MEKILLTVTILILILLARKGLRNIGEAVVFAVILFILLMGIYLN